MVADDLDRFLFAPNSTVALDPRNLHSLVRPAAAVMGAGLTSGRDRPVCGACPGGCSGLVGFSSSLNRAKMEVEDRGSVLAQAMAAAVGTAIVHLKPHQGSSSLTSEYREARPGPRIHDFVQSFATFA